MSSAAELFQQAKAGAEQTLAALSALEAMLPKEAAPVAPSQPLGLVGLQQPDLFYAYIRGDTGELFPKMSESQMAGVQALVNAGAGKLPLCWLAYCLATSYHETNRTMQAVKEGYWLSEDWRKQHLKYYPWYGRGLVQLTWEANYKKAGDAIGVDLIANPDKALVLENAVRIMIEGMLAGWFTGKSLRDFIPAAANRANYKNARQIINGLDKADLIAGYAIEFEKGLRLGDWR